MKIKSTEILLQGKPFMLQGMQEVSGLRITSEQKMIMKARFDGIAFWEIEEDQHRFVTDEIIFTMAAITGCYTPSTEILAKYLSDGIVSLIQDFGYDQLTVKEINLAIRLNVNPALKNPAGEDLICIAAPNIACVAFLAGVLRNYKVLRTNLDRLIENKLLGYK